VLGTGFAVITTEPLTTPERNQLRRRGAVAVTADADSELGRWLRRGGASAAVIRPDRTVMRAGRRVSALVDAVPSFAPSCAAASRCADA
jgi:3-(3-hydroxy-phenyl)propionate hydroxylase